MNPDLPSEMERIVNKALEKDRELRYQSASELRADLQRLKRDRDSGQKAVSTAPEAATIPSIAVLPFVNMSGDREQEFLSFARGTSVLNFVHPFDEVHDLLTGHFGRFGHIALHTSASTLPIIS